MGSLVAGHLLGYRAPRNGGSKNARGPYNFVLIAISVMSGEPWDAGN